MAESKSQIHPTGFMDFRSEVVDFRSEVVDFRNVSFSYGKLLFGGQR